MWWVGMGESVSKGQDDMLVVLIILDTCQTVKSQSTSQVLKDWGGQR